VRTTPLAGQPDPFSGYPQPFADMVQAEIEHIYARFLALVGQARGKMPQDVDKIAQGRVWDGGTARQIGLVDQFGGMDDALAYASARAGLKPGGWHAEYMRKPESKLTQLLRQFAQQEGDGDDDDSADNAGHDMTALASRRSAMLLARALADVTRISASQGIEAYCLDCPAEPSAIPPEPRDNATLGLLARLVAFTKE
jgi:protease-4